MDLVRTYGGDLAVLAVTGRHARITAPAPSGPTTAPGPGTPGPGTTTLLDVGEEIGHHAVVNRAVAGLPSRVGLVAAGAAGWEWPPGTLDALCDLALRHPRAGLLTPRSARPPTLLAPLLLRRAAWDSVDGFDTGETRAARDRPDTDVQERLRRAGWLVLTGVDAARPAGAEGVDVAPRRQGMLSS